MIKYWEFMLQHVDGGQEYINPVLRFEPSGSLFRVYNGYYWYEWDVSEINEWGLYPVYEGLEDV